MKDEGEELIAVAMSLIAFFILIAFIYYLGQHNGKW
jgi:hypothetical protein